MKRNKAENWMKNWISTIGIIIFWSQGTEEKFPTILSQFIYRNYR